jgi:nucleoside-diphosphate-sugar epimerase
MPGRPEAYLSSVHEADLGTAVAAALGVPAGVYNVVEDEPTTRGEHVRVLARAVGRPGLRDTGRLLAALSGRRLEMLSRSLRVSNRRFRDASGWRPSVPSVREGLAAETRH